MVQKTKIRPSLTPQLIIKLLVLLLVIAVIFLCLGDYGFYAYYKILLEEKNAREEQEYLRTLEKDKSIECDLLKNDKQYLEKIAREKYRMAKKGEIVYRVIEKEPENPPKNP